MRQQGVDYPIDYRNEDFVEVIERQNGDGGLDVIFDPIGGSYLKKGMKLLGAGGRLITFGASEFTNNQNILKKMDERKLPFSIPFDKTIVFENTIQLPEGYEIEYLPEEKNIDNEFGTYQFSITKENEFWN